MTLVRRVVGLLLMAPVLLLASGLVIGRSAEAATAPEVDAEVGFASHIADERVTRGLGHLAPADDLQDVARRHAQRMADRGEPYHNPNLGSEVQNWEIVAENVGVGSSVQQVHDAFMASQAHRDIILHPELTELGVGVVSTSDGRLWVVEVFRRPQAAAASEPTPQPTAAPAPAPLPTTAPAPVHAAAPAPTTTAVATAPSAPAPIAEMHAEITGHSAGAPAIGRFTRTTPIRRLTRTTPIVPLPDEGHHVPGIGWLAALLLVGVVGLFAHVVRRLGLVE